MGSTNCNKCYLVMKFAIGSKQCKEQGAIFLFSCFNIFLLTHVLPPTYNGKIQWRLLCCIQIVTGNVGSYITFPVPTHVTSHQELLSLKEEHCACMTFCIRSPSSEMLYTL